MATLTNPVEDQNIVNRFADYVPPAANTGITWGTNAHPFSHGDWPPYFGGSTGGRGLGISGASLKNSGELITGGGLEAAIENETFNYSSIRSLRARHNITGGGGNTGSQPTPGIIYDATAIAYMSTAYRQSSVYNGSIVLGSGSYTTIDDSHLEQKFSQLRDLYNAARGTTTTVTLNTCHASCHSSCHSSRGRR